MNREQCKYGIKYDLKTVDGRLTFTRFQVPEASCEEWAAKIREYLEGRPLKEVSIDEMKKIQCPYNDICLEQVIKEIKYLYSLTSRG